VLFALTAAQTAGLAKTYADGRLKAMQAQLSKPKSGFIDELDDLPLEPAAAHLFFRLVSRRHERASLPNAGNQPIGEGTGVR